MTPAIYQAYAPFYDGSGQIRFAVLMAQYLNELLHRHPVVGKRALDLACGTGTLACILAEHGWQVVGVDASPAMLALAEQKAQATAFSGDVRFLAGDMRNLDQTGLADHCFDLATCTYDSVNYLLTEADLAACFAQVAAALTPGGLFVFDMNTRYFLQHQWEAARVDEHPGFVEVQQSRFDATTDCSTMLLTCFVGDDTRGYERIDETHVERAYPPPLIDTLLQTAGFQVEAAYDCFTHQPPYERSQRIAWLARRL